MRHSPLAAVLLCSVVLTGQQALAVDNLWFGANNGSWNTASNWSLGTVPAAGENVFVRSPTLLDFGSQTANLNVSTPALGNVTIDGLLGTTMTLSQGFFTMSAGNLTVGDAGSGAYNLFCNFTCLITSIGPLVNVSGRLVLGNQLGSAGAFTQSNGILTTGETIVGEQRIGSFTQSGGIHTAGYFNLGNFPTGDGTYTLSGGTLTVGSSFPQMDVGNQGKGTFIQTGGTLSVTSVINIARQSGSSGSYTLSGAGSVNADELSVGRFGSGTFTQQGGSLTTGRTIVGDRRIGSFTQSGGTHTAGFFNLGNFPTGDGTYTLSGGTLTVGGPSNLSMDIGNQGKGTFIQTGGTLSVTGVINIARDFRSSGSYTLSGTGVINADTIRVGVGGTGTFTIEPTGTLRVENGRTLLVQVGGAGSSFTNNGTLQANAGGALAVTGGLTNLSGGTLTGGTYKIFGTAAQEGILSLPGNVVTNAATIVLSGPNSRLLNSANDLDALAGFINNGAAGNFTVENGRNFSKLLGFTNAGNVTVGNQSTFTVGAFFNPANYTQTGGVTTVNGTLAASNVDLNGGLLQGMGTIAGNVFNNANVGPGNSPGLLTINGNYTQSSSGRLLIELAGPLPGTQYDVLDVRGKALLAGLLDVSLFGGFDPTADAFFDVLLADDLSGTFGAVNLPTSSKGLFTLAYLVNPTGLDAVRILFDAADGEPPPSPPPSRSPLPPPGGQVPEPGTLFLMILGLAVLAIGRRRLARSTSR